MIRNKRMRERNKKEWSDKQRDPSKVSSKQLEERRWEARSQILASEQIQKEEKKKCDRVHEVV